MIEEQKNIIKLLINEQHINFKGNDRIEIESKTPDCDGKCCKIIIEKQK